MPHLKRLEFVASCGGLWRVVASRGMRESTGIVHDQAQGEGNWKNWLAGIDPGQRLGSALGLQGAHEALRGAPRSYSIKSELQDTKSASCWLFSSVQAAGV